MRVLSGDESRALARSLAVPWRSGEDLAWREALRAQLAAAGVTTRRALVERTLRWSDAPRGEDERARLYELLDDLDAVGDLSLGDDGLVGATALRAAVVHNSDTVLLLGTVPTPVFAQALGVAVEARRVRRALLPAPDRDALTDALKPLGGKVIDAMRWAGLDRAPSSPERFWEALDAREGLEELSAAEWNSEETQRLITAEKRARWRDDPRGDGLLRRRMDGGWHRYALRRDGRVLALTRDEATRAELALRRAGGALAPLVVRDEDGGARFTLSARVPRAEYRLLLGTADRVEGATWSVPRAVWPALAGVFRERLGWTVDDTALLRGNLG